MGKASREKGARGEREVCALFREAGFPCDRTPNSGGLFIPGDLTLCDMAVDGFHVEVKRAERLDIPGWCRQAEREALVASRSDRDTEASGAAEPSHRTGHAPSFPTREGEGHGRSPSPGPLPIPLLVYRSSREPWRVVLPLGDFLTLLTEARR